MFLIASGDVNELIITMVEWIRAKSFQNLLLLLLLLQLRICCICVERSIGSFCFFSQSRFQEQWVGDGVGHGKFWKRTLLLLLMVLGVMLLGASQTLLAFERKSSALNVDVAASADIEVRSKFCWSKFT